MKDNAICFLCKKRILDKKDYLIFSLPRYGFRYMIGHKKCYIDYKATHPSLYFGKGVSSFSPTEILNSKSFLISILAILIASYVFIFSIYFRFDIVIQYNHYLLIPVILAAVPLFIRIYFYLKYES